MDVFIILILFILLIFIYFSRPFKYNVTLRHCIYDSTVYCHLHLPCQTCHCCKKIEQQAKHAVKPDTFLLNLFSPPHTSLRTTARVVCTNFLLVHAAVIVLSVGMQSKFKRSSINMHVTRESLAWTSSIIGRCCFPGH